MNTIFKDKNGEAIYVLGLQAHNSSDGCWEMIDRSISAVKQYHGNTLEVPVYWYQIEPEEGRFDLEMVKTLIRKVRGNGLHLIILWFGFSKNADLTYMPEWAKLDTSRFRLAVEPDGGVVPMMSVHCEETIEADKKAFVELIRCIRAEDEKERTVIAVQVENEVGYYPIDRCYSKKAQEDFDRGVPKELDGVELEDSDAPMDGNSWHSRFGRYAHEAFSAWYFAKAIDKIASAGKEIYPSLPFCTNTAVGEVRQQVGGQSYPSGAPVGRVLEIWQKGAPNISAFGADIYQPHKSGYLATCRAHARLGNPLFIPETGTGGDGFAINHIHAAADNGAIGICGFGAESTLDGEGKLTESSQKVADTMEIIESMSPMLLRYAGTEKIFCVTQEEFQNLAYVKRKLYHITFYFTALNEKGRPLGRSLRVCDKLAKDPEIFHQRGRAIIYEASPTEYYIAGVGFTARFLRRTEPGDIFPGRTLYSRAATELAALTIEEGYFTQDGDWVCEFVRRGDEIDCGAFVYPGIVLKVKLNPNVTASVEW